MASLANQTISSTYDGLIKTATDQPVPASGVQLLEDGLGNSLSVSIGRTGNGLQVSGTVTATAFVGDGSGLTGISVSPTLDEVTDNGATTTNNITVGSVTATSFVKSGGTSAQFLKADGTVDSSTYLTSFTETNDLTAAVTWANVPDANITQSSVTQHQAALSITESQISDLQSYLTSNAVDSVNSQTGTVVLDADDIDDAATTNKFTTAGDISKLAGIEALADVTDAANVAAAGALMSGTAALSDLVDVSSATPNDGQVLTYDTTNGWQPETPSGGGGGTTYTISEISTSTTAVKDTLYVMRASLTLTLPASPSVGDKVGISNMSGTVTPIVARNGNLIAGLAEDLTIDVDSISVDFIYSGANEGWILFVDSILGYSSTAGVDGNGTTNYISKWSDANTLTDSVIFDNGTNVGIGTSSPVNKLDVVGNINVNDTSFFRYNGDTGLIGSGTGISGGTSTQLGIRAANDILFATGGASERMRIDASGAVYVRPIATYGSMTIEDNIVYQRTSGGGFASISFGNSFNSNNSTVIAFKTSNDGTELERMRITSGGDVLFGVTSLTINGSTGGAGFVPQTNGRYMLVTATTSTADGILFLFRNPNGDVGSIRTSGSSTSYNTSSDYRLKENVVPMEGALDKVSQLQPSRFNFIADPETTVDGFLAHQVQEVVPEAISGQKDEVEEYEITPAVLDDEGNVIEEAVMGTRPVYQGIDQSKLVPLLVGAIQELKAEIETLKSQK